MIADELSCKTDDPNWLSNREEAKPAEPLPTQALLQPRDAAVDLQFSFGWFARMIRPEDPFLQDDLIQVMSLAVLECTESATRAFFLARAHSRALNYLEYERVRGMISLEEINDRPALREERLQRFEGLLDSLINHGVDKAILEDILDMKIEVA